jgi:chorismate mutase
VSARDSAATDPASSTALDDHRRDIDRIDRTIVALLVERLRIGLTLGAIKRDREWPLRSPAREAEVLARVRLAAAGALTPESAARIFAAIIAETAAAEERADG